MKKLPQILLLLALFQLSLGIGWLFGALTEPLSIFCYEQFATHILSEKGQFLTPAGLDDERQLSLRPYSVAEAEQVPQVPVVTLHQSSCLNSFASYPPVPMDYMVLFRNLSDLGVRDVSVMAPLTWEESPDELVREAVGYELDRFRHKNVGRQMSESARTSPLPTDWEKLSLPPENIAGRTDLIPRADRFIGGNPQINSRACIVGTEIENAESPSQDAERLKSPPLFVRWDGKIIATLPLRMALEALEVPLNEVRLMSGDLLNLGNRRLLRVDETGRIPLRSDLPDCILDTQDVIITKLDGIPGPDTAKLRQLFGKSSAVLVSEPAGSSDSVDPHALQTARTVRSILGSAMPMPTRHFPEAPLWIQWIVVIDVLLLCFLTLLLRRRARLLAWIISVPILLLLSGILFVRQGIWLPFMIPICAVCGFALLSRFIPRWVSPPQSEPAEDTNGEDQVVPHENGLQPPPRASYKEPNEIPIPHRNEHPPTRP